MEPALEENHRERGGIGRIGATAVFYFMLVFVAGAVLGAGRELWVKPWLGETLSVLAEAPLLVSAMWFAAGAAPRWARLDGGLSAHFSVGVLALLLQQVADLAVGFGLRGMTLRDQLSYFTSPPGYVYLVTLVLFLIMPMARRLSRKGETP